MSSDRDQEAFERLIGSMGFDPIRDGIGYMNCSVHTAWRVYKATLRTAREQYGPVVGAARDGDTFGETYSGNGARDITAERHRQVSAEDWSQEHDDDEHGNGSLAEAAGAYLFRDRKSAETAWPWDYASFKWKDRRRNLVRAGALIAAEIDRLDRADALSAIPAKEKDDDQR